MRKLQNQILDNCKNKVSTWLKDPLNYFILLSLDVLITSTNKKYTIQNFTTKNNWKQKNKLLIISVFSLLLFIMFAPVSSAFAIPTISLDPKQATLGQYPIIITVDDSSNSEFTDIASGIQKIDVLLTSNVEQKTITLIETVFTDTVSTAIYTLSLRDALPISTDTISLQASYK